MYKRQGWGVANEYSPIVGSNSDTIPGAAGETTVNYFDTYGIPSIVVADGPGGIRIKQEYVAKNVETGEEATYYQYCTAWPVSVLRAQTWNTDLLEDVGEAYACLLYTSCSQISGRNQRKPRGKAGFHDSFHGKTKDSI